ncbi:MAG: glycosyltransferase, partial [Kineosporiaceae bacterium]
PAALHGARLPGRRGHDRRRARPRAAAPALPQGADQFLNAATAERAGVALALAPAQLTVGAVRDAVRRLLEEPGIRAAAHAVRADIDRMPGPDEVVASLVDRQ